MNNRRTIITTLFVTGIILIIAYFLFGAKIIGKDQRRVLASATSTEKALAEMTAAKEIVRGSLLTVKKEKYDPGKKNSALKQRVSYLEARLPCPTQSLLKLKVVDAVGNTLKEVGMGILLVVKPEGSIAKILNSKKIYEEWISKYPAGVPLESGCYKVGVFQKGFISGYADVCIEPGGKVVLPLCHPGKKIRKKKIKSSSEPECIVIPDSLPIQQHYEQAPPIIQSDVPCDAPEGDCYFLDAPTGS